MQQQRLKSNHPPKAPPTILIVDDQPDNLDLLVRILKKGGYNTRPALNGQLALGAVTHTRPDLILLDIRMPELDGFEICKRLKSDPHACDIPVIFISALDEADEKVRAFQAGAVDYISRPFQYQEVLVRVSTHLELARIRNQMAALVHSHTATLKAIYNKLYREITTHQATAQQLRQSKKNLRTLVKNQKHLSSEMEARIGSVAHELQHVLGEVIRNTEIIRSGGTKRPLNQQCQSEIIKASQRGQKAIKKLMKPYRKAADTPVPVELGRHT